MRVVDDRIHVLQGSSVDLIYREMAEMGRRAYFSRCELEAHFV